MIHYKDMKFCQETTCANFGAKCHRFYTDEVHQRAVKWWGSEDVPVSFYAGKPECYKASDKAHYGSN